MDILLVRGLPGSGKSTMAKQFVAKGWILCEADEYFYNAKGVYCNKGRRKLPKPAEVLTLVNRCIESIKRRMEG